MHKIYTDESATAEEHHSHVLPLENGDRLRRAEFERRYAAMPMVKKAELIKGIVYMGSPVHHTAHGRPHSLIMTWLGTYFAATPGIDLSDNPTVRLDTDTDVQPDALLRIDPAAGGRSYVSNDDYINGAPELIVEIAASSASYDLHDKLQVYQSCGVQEYLVWRVYDRQIDWWQWREGVYTPLPTDEQGVLNSRVFPGLRLDQAALLAGQLNKVLATLQQGLRSLEWQTFVAKLATAIQSDQ